MQRLFLSVLILFLFVTSAALAQKISTFPTVTPTGPEFIPLIGGACTGPVSASGDCKATAASISALSGAPGVVNVAAFPGVDFCDKLFNAANSAALTYSSGAILDARGLHGTQSCANWDVTKWPSGGKDHYATQIFLAEDLYLLTSVSIVLPTQTHLIGAGHGWGKDCGPPMVLCGGTTIQVANATTFPINTPLIDFGWHVTSNTGFNPAYDVRINDISISCSDFVSGANHHVVGSIGVRNINAQELSGGDHLEIEGCQLGIDQEDPEPGTLKCPKWSTSSCNGFGDASAFRDVQIFGTTALPNVPAPPTPTTGTTAGGSLTGRTYYVTLTYENVTGETFASAEVTQVVAGNNLLTVTSPTTPTASVDGNPAVAIAQYYNVYVSETPQTTNTITAASWAATKGGQVTFTTTSPHAKVAGDTFTVEGMTPGGYNGTFVAAGGTTGSVLVGTQLTNPGAATVLGNLVKKLGNRQNIFPVPLGTTWTEPVQGWGNNGPSVPKVDTTYPACGILNVPDGGLGASIVGGACTGSNLQNGFLVDGQVTAIEKIHIELGTNGRGVNIGTNSTNLLGFCAAGGPASCMQGPQFVQAGVIASHVTLTNINLGICITEPCAIVQNTGGNDIVLTNISNNGNGFYNSDNSYQSGAFTYFQPAVGAFPAYFTLNGIPFMDIGPNRSDGKTPASFNPTESRLTSYFDSPVHFRTDTTFDNRPNFPTPFSIPGGTTANPGGDRQYGLRLLPGTGNIAGLLYGLTNATPGKAVLVGEGDTGTGEFRIFTADDFSWTVAGACGSPPCGTWSQRFEIGHSGQGMIVGAGTNPGAMSTAATGPFVYIPVMAGKPTGSPSWTDAGLTPTIYDSSNKKLCVYDPTVGDPSPALNWRCTAAMTAP